MKKIEILEREDLIVMDGEEKVAAYLDLQARVLFLEKTLAQINDIVGIMTDVDR